MCVCVQSTNMFSASSRRSNQSSLRNLSNSHPQKGLLPAGAAMSQQWQLWEEASSRPGASLPLLPAAWPPGSLLWHRCPSTHSWNWPAQAAKGFFPPPPSPCPSPHPPFYFSFSQQNQNTAFMSSGATAKWQELAVEGLGHRSCPGPSRPGDKDTSCLAVERPLLGTVELCLSPMGQKCHCLGLQGIGGQGGVCLCPKSST